MHLQVAPVRPCALLILLVLSVPVGAQDQEADSKQVDQQHLQAILDAADSFREAYNSGDAERLGKLFTVASEFVDGSGNVFHGRQAIVAEYQAYFRENQGNTIRFDIETVRYVAPGVLMEEGLATVIPEIGTGRSVTVSGYTAVHAKQPNGTWQIASVRSTTDDEADAHEELKKLAWLIGEWVDESPESVVLTTWDWSSCGNFLLGQYRIMKDGQIIMHGDHRLGWDAGRDQPRSWVFDSSGGFVQGLWTEIDGGWIVKVTGVTAEGKAATSTNAYRVIDENSYTWSSRDRLAGEESLPNLEIMVVRKPPVPVLGN